MDSVTVPNPEQSNMNQQSQILAFDSRQDVDEEQAFNWSPSEIDPTDSTGAVPSHCEVLTKELEELDAEGHLLEPETYSEDDCIKLTNSLNAKIQHISVSVVRACCESTGTTRLTARGVSSSSNKTNNSSISNEDLLQIQTIRSMIGEQAYEFFLGLQDSQNCRGSDSDQLHYKYIVRCAIQATLAALCNEILNAWSFNKEENNVLSNIYILLHNQFGRENPALTGTWKSLTRSQTKIARYHDLKPTAIRTFISETTKVLVISGGISWNLDDGEGIIQNYFQEEFADLYNYCFRLDRLTGESIRSFDLQFYLPEPGESYARGSMYNMDSNTKFRIASVADSGITCTSIAFCCRLGLLRVGAVEQEADDTSPGRFAEEILLKAGVQLANLISDCRVDSTEIWTQAPIN
ncbi:hypothetical protein F5876DRAFT_78415 [Lentinula aff. lateritia]|uniref:Uncharacterized protein n=1 Tax=Lentinula aff. lateritia TaxID=2804960 RepID=A0ACC1TVF1_9AGAR|nr:hypothetical protein F5876DRAFT_78415 [Lentinula aff. lateritia]